MNLGDVVSHHFKLFLFLLLLTPQLAVSQTQPDTAVEKLYRQAEELFEEGEYDDSKSLFLEISEKLCLNENLAENCIDSKIYLSHIERNGRNFEASENHLDEAEFLLAQKLGTAHPLQTEINLQKVFLFVDMTDFDKAESVVQSSMQLIENESINGLPKARVCFAQAYLEDARGNYHNALQSYSDAVLVAESMDQNREVLRFLSVMYNNMGVVAKRIGDLNQAMDYYQEGLEVTKSLYGENHPDLGLLYNNIGVIYYNLGDYGQAADYFLRTADIFRENYGEDNARVAGGYNNAGAVYLQMGDVKRATEILEKAQRIKENLLGEDHLDTAIGYSSLASIYLENKNYDAALENFQRSIAVRRNIYGSNHPNLVTSYINLGEYYTVVQNYSLARDQLNEALRIIRDRLGDNHPDEWDVLLKIGDSYEKEAEYQLALDHYERAFDKMIRDSGIGTHAKINAGELSYPLRFISAAKKIGDVHLHQYDENSELTDLHQAIDHYDMATEVVDFLQKSYQSEASKLNLIDQNYSIFTNTIKAYHKLYEETEEEFWLEEILKTSEISRSRIALELLQDLEAKNFAGVPGDVLDTERNINKNIADYYQKIHAERNKGLEANDEIIATYRDSLFEARQNLAELTRQLEQNYPEYYRLKYDQSFADREVVSNLLTSDETLLNYIVSKEQVYALILDKENISFHVLGEPDSLSSQIKALREVINTDDVDEFSEISFSLYQKLIEPVISEIKSKSVVVVPDQMLHYLPFEMLITDQPAEPNYFDLSYLIRDYRISYVPSATVLQVLDQKKISNPQNLFAAAPFSETTVQMNASDEGSRYLTDLSPLPLTRYETREIAEIFEQKDSFLEYLFPEEIKLLSGRKVTKEVIENTSFEEFGFLHFATHAFVNEDNPSLSGIAFWGDENEDGIMYVNDIYNMNFNADLVTLGACETGLGTVYKGEGLIGFTRAFIYAGVSNLLVSLWRVNDQPTASLMIHFYKFVKEGYSYSESLQMAKMELMSQPEYAAPRNWAAFVLHGR